MNGYQMTADSYRALLAMDHTIDRAATEKKIKALEFLASCDRGEIMELFNSSAFNNVVKGYVKMACDNRGVDEEMRRELLNEINYLFDTVGAEQAEDYY